jgi:hypothetical protein
MSKTIASAHGLNDSEIGILVDAGEANSLHNFLRNKGVSCTQPSPAISTPRRVTRDGMGRLHIEEDVLECAIIAEGSMNDFANWMEGWIMGEQQAG